MITTENQLWQAIAPDLRKFGLPVRLENTASVSVPDVAYIMKNHTFWLELKIVKSNKFTMPKFQYAFGVQLANIVDYDLFWLIAQEKETLWAMHYINIISSAKPYLNNRVQVDISNVPKEKITNVAHFLNRYLK